MGKYKKIKEAIMSEIEKLKEALRFAILNTSRVSKRLVDYDSAGSTYEVDWLQRFSSG